MNDLLIVELLLFFVYSVGFLVLWEFFISENGVLRKIMIAYFSAEVIMYVGLAVFFFYQYETYHYIPYLMLWCCFLAPKEVVKFFLLWYLITNRINSKK